MVYGAFGLRVVLCKGVHVWSARDVRARAGDVR